jgi:hypothetical protein
MKQEEKTFQVDPKVPQLYQSPEHHQPFRFPMNSLEYRPISIKGSPYQNILPIGFPIPQKMILKQTIPIHAPKPKRKSRVSKRNAKNACCDNCKCETSPLWRKGDGTKILCNKCGISNFKVKLSKVCIGVDMD